MLKDGGVVRKLLLNVGVGRAGLSQLVDEANSCSLDELTCRSITL